MKELKTNTKNKPTSIDEEKRDFLFITTAGLAIAGGGAFAWSMIDTMNPSKDVLALSTTEVDLSPLEEGQSLTVMWRGKPIFIRHRSESEISSASNVSIDQLPHKESDESRVKNPKWLVVVGVCSHLGSSHLATAEPFLPSAFGFQPSSSSHREFSTGSPIPSPKLLPFHFSRQDFPLGLQTLLLGLVHMWRPSCLLFSCLMPANVFCHRT